MATACFAYIRVALPAGGVDAGVMATGYAYFGIAVTQARRHCMPQLELRSEAYSIFAKYRVTARDGLHGRP